MKKTREDKITISEILHGTQAGRMQSVGYLQVLPLVSKMSDDRFLPPNELEVATGDYGKLEFYNTSEQIGIVPLHSGYIVKQLAQDHALLHVGVVDQNDARRYETACCIQQSQGGLIRGDKHKLVILPYSLREKALALRNKKGYDRMWPSISKLNERFGIRDQGNLVRFFDTFRDELDGFEAQFEPVEYQVGAIILLDGEVVGVERTPSHEYWKALWPSLIRGCYASLAMEYQKSLGDDFPLPSGRCPFPSSVATLAELKEALRQAEKASEDYARSKVRELIGDPFSRREEERLDSLVLETVVHDQLTGQIIQEEDRICYASLIVRDSWQKKRQWRLAEPFTV